MSSAFRKMGLTVLGVAAGAFIAMPVLAEPPSHGFNARPPRVDAPQRPHVFNLHKPPPEFAPHQNDHTPHIVVTRLPQQPNLPRTHLHKDVAVVAIPRPPHGPNKGLTTINIVHVPHVKTFKIH